MVLQQSPEKMVGTRSKPGDFTNSEIEKLKLDIEKAQTETAQARSENESLRKQLDRLIELNETLLVERAEQIGR